MTTVVIGIGNRDRGDDGAGTAVTGLLRGRRLPPTVAVVDTDGDPARLLDAWDGADAAIIIDAVHSHLAPAGHVHRLAAGADTAPGAALALAAGPATSHGLGPGDAIALGAALDRLPRSVLVFAIEGERFGLGDDMSPAVRCAVTALADDIEAMVEVPPCA